MTELIYVKKVTFAILTSKRVFCKTIKQFVGHFAERLSIQPYYTLKKLRYKTKKSKYCQTKPDYSGGTSATQKPMFRLA